MELAVCSRPDHAHENNTAGVDHRENTLQEGKTAVQGGEGIGMVK